MSEPYQTEVCIRSCKQAEEKIPIGYNDTFPFTCFKDDLAKCSHFHITGHLLSCPHKILGYRCDLLKIPAAHGFNSETFKESYDCENSWLLLDTKKPFVLKKVRDLCDPCISLIIRHERYFRNLSLGGSCSVYDVSFRCSQRCNKAFLVLLQFIPDTPQIGSVLSYDGNQLVF